MNFRSDSGSIAFLRMMALLLSALIILSVLTILSGYDIVEYLNRFVIYAEFSESKPSIHGHFHQQVYNGKWKGFSFQPF